MGAVNFSLDVNLADILRRELDIEAFVETGTFRGETVEALKDKFNKIYTIELSSEYYVDACAKFDGLDHIQVLQGDSAQVLKTVVADLKDEASLYFWMLIGVPQIVRQERIPNAPCWQSYSLLAG